MSLQSILLDLWQLYLQWSIADQQDSSVVLELFEVRERVVVGIIWECDHGNYLNSSLCLQCVYVRVFDIVITFIIHYCVEGNGLYDGPC